MKVAILSTGDFEDMKGIMNYVQEKARIFQNLNSAKIHTDVFFVVTRMSFILSFIYRCLGRPVCKTNYKSGDVYEKDGVNYILLVRKLSVLNTIYTMILNQFVPKRVVAEFKSFLGGYDIISTHQLPCHYIANELKRMNGIPYVATWHGSDINITPRESCRFFNVTKKVMENANMNFFVSKGLMNASNYISAKANKDYIYTGPSKMFVKYSDKSSTMLRHKFMVEYKKVVMFVGNLIPVKNVMLLPQIFHTISKKNKEVDIEYWIIGDGFQKSNLERELSKADINFKMFGRKKPCDMPEFMNVADILVVPSLHEGFPLVVLEARACGCYPVASNVGGLPESAGEENCFPLNDDFIDNITNKIVYVLNNGIKPEPLPNEMSWDVAVQKEILEMSYILEFTKNA